MRARMAAVLAAIAVLTTAAAASGGAAEPRRATLPYAPTDDNFTVGGPENHTVVGTGDGDAQYDFPIEKGEKSVEVFIQDDTELPVGGIVTQWKQTDHQEAGPASRTSFVAVTWQRFCGMTPAPVKLKPKLDVRIILHEGTLPGRDPVGPDDGRDSRRLPPELGK